MCRSVYSYVFSNHLYVPNTFLALLNLSVFSTRDHVGKNLPIPTFLGARSESQRMLDMGISSRNCLSVNVRMQINIWYLTIL